jgi:hypothetical protein
VLDVHSDSDGVADCLDGCPNDAGKTAPGQCGCGVADTDSDNDGTANCNDGCPSDNAKTAPGVCGCGVSDVDTDMDTTPDCNDGCPNDSTKTTDVDSDSDTVLDCNDECPNDVAKAEPGICGCGSADVDTDGDEVLDCHEACNEDVNKLEPGLCGCGVPDQDSDGDGTLDCDDLCPSDPEQVIPGDCGCASTPEPAGTACGDGVCVTNSQCNGAGRCGSPEECEPDSNCSLQWFGGSEYFVCDNDRTWSTAKANCEGIGSGWQLARIDTDGENNFLRQFVSGDMWVGGSDTAIEGVWVWEIGDAQFWQPADSPTTSAVRIAYRSKVTATGETTIVVIPSRTFASGTTSVRRIPRSSPRACAAVGFATTTLTRTERPTATTNALTMPRGRNLATRVARYQPASLTRVASRRSSTAWCSAPTERVLRCSTCGTRPRAS